MRRDPETLIRPSATFSLRLQVDDSPEPLKELRRLIELAAKQRVAMEESRKTLK